jgi:hypothetical protein
MEKMQHRQIIKKKLNASESGLRQSKRFSARYYKMILLKKKYVFELKSLSRLYRNSAKVCSAKAFLMQFEFNAPSLGPPNRISGFYQGKPRGDQSCPPS